MRKTGANTPHTANIGALTMEIGKKSLPPVTRDDKDFHKI
jgi:hypothetical protein